MTREVLRVSLLGRDVLTFHYDCMELGRMDLKDHMSAASAVVAGLSGLMDRTSVEDPLAIRALMLQRIGGSQFDDARKFLLINMLETYWVLEPEQRETFRMALAREGFREAREMEVTWADRIREERREEGRYVGLLQGKREVLLRHLATKFGPLPKEVSDRVEALATERDLDLYLDRVLAASSLAEMGLD